MPTLPDKDTYTTGEIARFCGLTKHTVLAAIERGELQSRQTLGGHNRIDRQDALRFLRRKGYLGDTYGNACILVLAEESLLSQMICELVDLQEVDVQLAGNLFDAGRMVERLQPQLVVCDLALGVERCVVVAEYAAAQPTSPEKRFLGIGTESQAEDFKSLCEHKVGILHKPFTMNSLDDRLSDCGIPRLGVDT